MNISNWLTIIGWIVTFILGVISAVIVQRKVRKRKIISWSVISEKEFFSQKISESIDLPVKILVDNNINISLSGVSLRIGNTGNDVIKDLRIFIVFNKECDILNYKYINELGVFKENIIITKNKSKMILELGFINASQIIDLEFILGNYEMGSVEVDLSAPEVTIKKKEATKWDLPDSFLSGLALGLAGVKYDPSVAPLKEIVAELRAINKKFDK